MNEIKREAKKLTSASVQRTKQFKEIKRDLLNQLERNGTFGVHFTSLVDDYMEFYITKCLLNDDIRARGMYVPYDNGGGQKGTRKNDSIDQMLKVNNQMLKILAELDIKPSQAVMEDEEL